MCWDSASHESVPEEYFCYTRCHCWSSHKSIPEEYFLDSVINGSCWVRMLIQYDSVTFTGSNDTLVLFVIMFCGCGSTIIIVSLQFVSQRRSFTWISLATQLQSDLALLRLLKCDLSKKIKMRNFRGSTQSALVDIVVVEQGSGILQPYQTHRMNRNCPVDT